MALIRKTGTKTVGEDVEKLEPSHAAGVAILTTPWQFLKRLHVELPHDPAVALLGIYPREPKNIHLHRNSSVSVHSSIMADSPKVGTTQTPING